MSANRYDVIVIGAGHNGLVTASYLAKAGQKVLVLEAGEQVGGAARRGNSPRDTAPRRSPISCMRCIPR